MTLHPLVQIRYIFGPKNDSNSYRRSLSHRTNQNEVNDEKHGA